MQLQAQVQVCFRCACTHLCWPTRCAPGSLSRLPVRMREAADRVPMPKILPCPPQWGKGPEAQRGGGSNPTHTVCGTQLLRHMLGAGARRDTTCSPLMAQETSQSAADSHRVCTVLFACTPYCPEACHQSATKAYRNTASSHGSSSHAGARRAPSLRPMWRYANLSAYCCGMSAPHPECKPWAWAVGVPHRGPP